VKLGKTSILLLAVGIAVIAFISLGVARAQQLQEQDRVNEELSLVTWRLNTLRVAQLQSQCEELEEQLGQITVQLEATRTVLTLPVGSIDADDLLFSIAEYCNVEITGIISSGIRGDMLEGVPCSVLTLNVDVEGDVSDLISFANSVNADFETGAIEAVDIQISDNTTEQRPTAGISLNVYAYRGN